MQLVEVPLLLHTKQGSEQPPKQISQHFHRHKATSSSSYHCKLLLGSATDDTTPKRVRLEPHSPNEEPHGSELCPPSAQSTHCTIIDLPSERYALLNRNDGALMGFCSALLSTQQLSSENTNTTPTNSNVENRPFRKTFCKLKATLQSFPDRDYPLLSTNAL